MTPNRQLLLGLVLLLMVLLTACTASTGTPATSDTDSSSEGDTIRFGVIQPLTGPVADAGAYVLNGLQIGVDRINEEGGVCGRQLEPIILDGKNDPQESANAAENLITREKVPIIMGAWGSSSTLAVMPVVARHQVPLLVETSSSGKITDASTPGFEWTFRISPTSQMEAEAAQAYLVDKLGMTKVAILSVNNDWGRGAGEVFRTAIEEAGGEIVSEDYIDQSVTDVLPQLTSINNSGADSILITTSAGQIATIMKQYNELGMTQAVLTTGGSNYPIAVMELSSKKIVEGTHALIFYVPTEFELAGDAELAEWYLNEYEERDYPAVGLGESYRGFDGVHVIARAIELNDCNLDPEGLQAAIPQVKFQGLSGQISFDEADGHQSRPNVYLVRVENGELTVPEFQFEQ